MHRHPIVISLLALSLTLGACELTSPDDRGLVCSKEPQPGVIQPLEVGNYWTFQVRGTAGRFIKMITQSVVDSLEFAYEGRDIRAWQIYWDHGHRFDDQEGTPLLSNGIDGLYNNGMVRLGDTVLTNGIRLLYPTTAGTQFDPGGTRILSGGLVREFDDLRTTVVSTDSIIATPAGLFSAYVYSRTHIPSGDADDELEVTIDLFYSPGIGPVAEITHSRLGTHKELLADYLLCRWE